MMSFSFPSNFSKDLLKPLLVIKNLVETQRKSGQAVPASVLDRLKAMSEKVSSLPHGYSWVNRLIRTLNPEAGSPVACVNGGAGGMAVLEETQESLDSLNLRCEHLALLIEYGAIAEARELYDSIDPAIRMDLNEFLGEASILVSTPEGSTLDPIFLRSEHEKMKKLQVYVVVRQMLEDCRLKNQEALRSHFYRLNPDDQAEIHRITNSLMITSNPVFFSPETRDFLHRTTPFFIKIAALSIFEGRILRMQKKANEARGPGTIAGGAGALAGAGAGAKIVASGKKGSSEALDCKIVEPRSTDVYIKMILQIVGGEFKSIFGFDGGLLCNLMVFSSSHLKEEFLPKVAALGLDFKKVLRDLMNDLAENRQEEAAVRCSVLLVSIAESTGVNAFKSLAEACNPSNIEALLAEVPCFEPEEEQEKHLDTSYLDSSYTAGCLAAFDQARLEGTYFYPIKQFVFDAISLLTRPDIDAFGAHIDPGKEDMIKGLSPKNSTAIGKLLSSLISKRVENAAALLGEIKKMEVCLNQFVDRLCRPVLSKLPEGCYEFEHDEKISLGKHAVKNEYELLMRSQTETIACLKGLARVLETLVQVATDEFCYRAVIIDDSITNSYFETCKDEGVEGAIRRYRSTHSDEEIEAVFEKKGFDASNILSSIQVYREVAVVVRTALRDLERMQKSYESEYIVPSARLRALLREGIIKLDKATPEMILPAVMTKSVFSDGFGHKVRLPPLPVVCEMPLPDAPPALTSTASDSATSIDGSASLSESEDALKPNLEELVPAVLQNLSGESLFEAEQAKKAFSNGLQYGLFIHHLLSHLRVVSSPHQVKQMRKDIATASYYALEQIITALMLEKNDKMDPESMLKLFETAGHNLLARCKIAGIRLPREIESILKQINGKNHSLTLTSFLAGAAKRSAVEAAAVGDDAHEARSAGVDAMKALFWFLRQYCVRRSSKHFSSLVDVQREMAGAIVPPPATEDPAAASLAPLAMEAPRPPAAARSNEDLPKLRGILLSCLRDPSIAEKIERLEYCVRNLDDPEKPELARFYMNQANYALLDIMENAFIRAAELQGLCLDQKSYRHRLDALAADVGLTGLSEEEGAFLERAYKERNSARYNFDVKRHKEHRSSGTSEHSGGKDLGAGAGKAAHVEDTAVIAHRKALFALGAKAGSGSRSSTPSDLATGSSSDTDEADAAGFTAVLSSSDARLKGKMEKSIALALSIVQKLATHLAASSK